MRTFTKTVLIVFMFLIASSAMSCAAKTENTVTKNTQLEQRELKIKTLAAKNNAVSGWYDNLLKNNKIYSIEIQDRIKKHGNNPLIFEDAELVDIYSNGAETIGIFNMDYITYSIVLELVLKEDSKQKLISDSQEFFNNYAVVVLVTSTNKISLYPEALARNEQEAELQITPESPLIIRGTLIDFIKT